MDDFSLLIRTSCINIKGFILFDMKARNVNLNYYLIVALLVFNVSFAKPQSSNLSAGDDSHELTVYVFPTLKPLDWTSPSSLYKSTMNSYLKTIFLTDNYLLGHMAIKLQTSLLDKPLLTAQTSCGMDEKRKLLFNEKIGLGILGATLKGRMEPAKELMRKLNVYARRDKITFIKYKLNEKSTLRIIDFVKMYSSNMMQRKSQSEFYGGSFWPRYRYEGAGCSAFAVAVLELAGIQPPDSSGWKINVKIPMNLIGGKFNNGKKIKSGDIKRTLQWHNGEGEKNVNYFSYTIYDPTFIYNWVKNKMQNITSGYQVVSENGVLGLLVDATTVECDEHEPIFLDNDAPDLFVAAHFQEYKEFPFAEISADSLQRMQVPDILKLDSTSVTRH